MGRVFANGLGDLGSIPGRVIPKTLKIVLDTSLLNIQQYKVCIKGKVEQSRERSSALPYTSVLKLLKLLVTLDYSHQVLLTICLKTQNLSKYLDMFTCNKLAAKISSH